MRDDSCLKYSTDKVFCQEAKDWAEWWATRGIRVLPLKPFGKSPLSLFAPHGVHSATTDLTVIREWWEREPQANYGVETGQRLIVLDIDRPIERPEECYKEIERKVGLTLPPTALVRTGSGGVHMYYRLPEGIRAVRGRVLLSEHGKKTVEVKGEGGYVVGVGSRTEKGNYVWLKRPTGLDDLACAPAELLERLGLGDRRGRRERGSRLLVEPVEIEIGGQIVLLDPAARPPERFLQELERDSRLKAYWDRLAYGPEQQDDSQSGYDLVLANALALRGYSVQEIADIIVAYRRRHGADLKHDLYYVITIETALEQRETIGEKVIDMPFAFNYALEQEPAEVQTSDLLPIDWGQKPRKKEKPIIHGLLHVNKITLLAGEAGIGKTSFVLDLLAAIKRKRAFGLVKPENIETTILYFTEEDESMRLRAERRGLVAGDIGFVYAKDVAPLREDHYEAIEAVVREENRKGKTVILVIDPVLAFLEFSEKGEWSGAEVRKRLRRLARLVQSYDIALLLVAHYNKIGNIADSVQFQAIADVVLRFEREGKSRKLIVAKTRIEGGEGEYLAEYDQRSRTYTALGLPTAVSGVLEVIRERGQKTFRPKELKSMTGLTDKQINDRLADLCRLGLVRKIERGVYEIVEKRTAKAE